MRIFVAGATGVIGSRLVPLLVEQGHQVAGMTRSASRTAAVEALGARAVVCDAFDATALREAVAAFGPDCVVHQLTDLPDDPADLAGSLEANARIRREGTANLVAAAQAAGASRFVAQSIAWEGSDGGAVADLERQVLAIGGVVLRYGQLYGPGTFFAGEPPPPPRIHADEAARRTVAALDAASGVLTLVEDAG